MFSKIPQKFSAPFGILGDEAKLAFPSQPGGITKLWTTRNIPAGDSYWEQYFVLFDSASDVFALITPHQIRRALHEAPENVATLIRAVCHRLFDLMTDHTFPTPISGVAAFASSLMGRQRSGLTSPLSSLTPGGSGRDTTKEVLNCIRILQRVMPVVFDVQGEQGAFEMEVLWKVIYEAEAPRSGSGSVAGSEGESQFVIEDDEDGGSDDERPPQSSGVSTPNPSQPAAPKKKKIPSLGERLMNSLIDLMYCCGFTLAQKVQVDHHKVQYIIWEKGIGSTSDSASNSAFDSNKVEVLRLLLVLFSRQIYVSPNGLFSNPSIYTQYLVQKIPRRDVLTVLCSLLNTVLNSSAPHDSSVAASLGAMAGKLPYNHLVFKGEDPRMVLTGMCLQVLCVILDFQSGTAKDVPTPGSEVGADGEGFSASPTPRSNAFRYFLMKLHRTQDFEFILNGINGILTEEMNSMNKLLPGAKKPLPYIPETIILFWKIIELNKKFRAYFLESEKSMDLVSYLLCYCIEIKDKPQQHGLCRAISYIIQTLSAEPGFGAKLGTTMKASVPTTWNGVNTVGDFLVHAIYFIVGTTSGTLNALYPALIIALSNCAPHFRKLSVTAANCLLQLFTSFANPSFLLADEGHPRLLFFMLEAFNGVIQNNLAENPTLVYDVLTSYKVFEDLGNFTLVSGLREIKSRELAKEEMAKRAAAISSQTAPAKNKGKNPAEDTELNDPVAEKALLLSHESWDQAGSLEEAAVEGNVDGYEAAASSSPRRSGSFDSDYSHGSVGGGHQGPSSPLSEKAKGKLRERTLRNAASQSVDRGSISLNLDQLVMSVGRNGFVPTQDWVTSWQQGLPLDPVMILISELLPKVQNIQASKKGNSLNFILDFIAHASLHDVLPAPLPISPRRFTWSDGSIVWLTSLIWGEVYVRGMSPYGVWNATNVKLFYVKHSTAQPRQITETVSNVVGGFLGRRQAS